MKSTAVSFPIGKGLCVRKKDSPLIILEFRLLSISKDGKKATVRINYPNGLRVTRLPID